MKKPIKFIAAALLILTSRLSAQTDPTSSLVQKWLNGAMSLPCVSPTTPWTLGGNILTPPPPPSGLGIPNPLYNDIGTCNDYPFILKANNFRSVYIFQSGQVGINNTNIGSAAFAISHPTSPNSNSLKFYGDVDGNIETDYAMNLNFGTSAAFAINEGTPGNSTNALSIVSGGNVGIGTTNPTSKLQVSDANGASALIISPSSNTSKLSVTNNLGSYDFKVDGAGVGRISDGGIDYLNFKTTSNLPQVWIWGPGGAKKPVGTHSDFSFGVYGKIVARSIYVTADIATNWADYVFADDYKLPLLSDVENFYKKNKHLPEIPTTKDVEERGIDLGEMNTLLLKKVEELTLYIVEQEKKLSNQQRKMEAFEQILVNSQKK